MPELPEVEVMTGRLESMVAGADIGRVLVHRDNGKYFPGQEQEDLVRSRCTIESVRRRGKKIIFFLNSGKAIVCHNAMSGYWDMAEKPWTFDYVENKRISLDKDVRVEIETSNGTLRFHDSRLFGFLRHVSIEDVLEDKIGPEPIPTEFMVEEAPVIESADEFYSRIQIKKVWEIKRALMDPAVVVGIGNIYSAEALWESGIAPGRTVAAIPRDEVDDLYKHVKSTLRSAIARDLDYGELKVYRRKNCCRCLGSISNEKIEGRSSYYCKTCQA